MRAMIKNNNGTTLDITLQRSVSDTPEAAYTLTREIAAALNNAELKPAQFEITPAAHRIGDLIAISMSLPITTIAMTRLRDDGSQAEYSRAVALPREPAQRGLLVAAVEDVLNQYLTRVDAIRAVGWCLQDLRDWRTDLFWQEQVPIAQIDTLESTFIAAREELIMPYIEGKYPVMQTELFAEFHQLSLLEQQVIAAACRHAQSSAVLNAQNARSSLLPDNERAALWSQVVAQVLQSNWLIEVPAPRWGAGEIWLGRGQKSMLLPPFQMMVI